MRERLFAPCEVVYAPAGGASHGGLAMGSPSISPCFVRIWIQGKPEPQHIVLNRMGDSRQRMHFAGYL